jgi:hypothetical protein
MNTETSKLIYPELSYKIIWLAMEVHRTLGYGFLEKVYENALMVLCEREQIHAQQQAEIGSSLGGGGGTGSVSDLESPKCILDGEFQVAYAPRTASPT